LYVRDVASGVIRPAKELKGFEKVELEPGESASVTFTLGKRAFAFYDADISDWRVESGDFEVLIRKSSADIVLRETVRVSSTAVVKKNYTLDSTLADIKDEPAAVQLIKALSDRFGAGQSLGMDMDAMFSSIKIRSLVPMGKMMGGGNGVSLEQLRGMVDVMNS
jgi:beta-glucosidase